MGAAEDGAGEILRGPAGALGAGAGRKMRYRRPRCGLRVCHNLSFQIEAPRWGGVSRAWDYGRRGPPSSGLHAASGGVRVKDLELEGAAEAAADQVELYVGDRRELVEIE